ncbi:hypothetical protein AYI70_g1741, partial [Smittium culicis]
MSSSNHSVSRAAIMKGTGEFKDNF